MCGCCHIVRIKAVKEFKWWDYAQFAVVCAIRQTLDSCFVQEINKPLKLSS